MIITKIGMFHVRSCMFNISVFERSASVRNGERIPSARSECCYNLKEMALYHLIVYTPLSHADMVRSALADAGAGAIGNYTHCSFSVRGTGRFLPNENAKPAIGSAGALECVEEERIEVVVSEDRLRDAVRAARKAHPYDEPAIHVLEMKDYKEFLG